MKCFLSGGKACREFRRHDDRYDTRTVFACTASFLSLPRRSRAFLIASGLGSFEFVGILEEQFNIEIITQASNDRSVFTFSFVVPEIV